MKVGMSWGALGHGQGWAEFRNIDEAMAALWRAVVRACQRVDVIRCDVLRRAGTVLRHDMDTRGRRAVAHGRKWEKHHGIAWAALHPFNGRNHGKARRKPHH